MRRRIPGVKKVVVEERRYDTLEESSPEADSVKLPATLPGNPSAEGALPSEPMVAAALTNAFDDSGYSSSASSGQYCVENCETRNVMD